MDQIQHSKPVPPFVKFCAANIPMVFDDSLSYYEALCALWKWLQTDVIDVINNNASVTEDYIEYDLETRQLFIQLKEYVDNYFANLDVQEEINNKLDAMVEDGTLQEIITTYIQSNVTWTFDTVADMQLGTNFVDGSYARTLGYYAINDGGAGEYKIRTKTESDTPDGGSLIAISETLVAELTYTTNVNVKQFGAYGDGTHDDTTAIQNAIDYVKSIIIDNDDIVVDEPIVTFSGRFKVTDTIDMPPYIKYQAIGNVLILADVSDGTSVFHLNYASPIPTIPSSTYSAQQWLHGDLFYGGEFRLLSINDLHGTAIELGNSSNPESEDKSMARTILKNISIQNFDTAILCNMYNFYIFSFNNIKMHHNNYHVKFGSTVQNNVNSGENISFVDCLFGTSTYEAIQQNVSEINVTFERCSFDYCGDGIMKINRNINANMNNCHIEGIVTSDATGYFYVPATATAGGVQLYFNNTKTYQHDAVKPLVYCGNSAYLTVTFLNAYYYITKETATGLDEIENQYAVNGSASAIIKVVADNVDHSYIQMAHDVDLNSEGNFEHIAADTIVATDGYYSVSANTNYKGGTDTYVRTIDGRKYVDIVPADSPASQNGNFLLRRAEYIPIIPNRRYMASMGIRLGDLVDPNGGVPNVQFNVYLDYFDETKTQVGSQQYCAGRATDYSIGQVNKTYRGKRNVICQIPNDKRIKYAVVRYQFESKTNLSNLTHVYLTGLSFEESLS
jgi:hypothetical protein